MNELIEEENDLIGLLQIGNAYFKEPTTRSDLSVFLERKYERVLESEDWKFKKKETSLNRWDFIFQLIHTATINKLKFRANLDFMDSVLHIRMPFLTDLDLKNNKIHNIQSLTFLDAPNLQYINLKGNKITHITRVLNKLNFKKLNFISIEGNYINSVDLGRLQVSTQKGEQFDFQFDMYQTQGISFLGKSKPLSFDSYKQSTRMLNSKSINQGKCYYKLYKRFVKSSQF